MTHSMVAFFALLSFALHANSMSAASFPCLTDAHAHEIIADQIISVSQALGYVEAIKRLHTKDAIGISDSINFVMGLPVRLSTTFRLYELTFAQAQHDDNAFTEGAITAEQRVASYWQHQDFVSQSYTRHHHIVLRVWHNAVAYLGYHDLLCQCGT